jgi:hypothetical protein
MIGNGLARALLHATNRLVERRTKQAPAYSDACAQVTPGFAHPHGKHAGDIRLWTLSQEWLAVHHVIDGLRDVGFDEDARPQRRGQANLCGACVPQRISEGPKNVGRDRQELWDIEHDDLAAVATRKPVQRPSRSPVPARPTDSLMMRSMQQTPHLNVTAEWWVTVPLAALLRCNPLVPGLQPQAKAPVIDTQIPVRAAQNRLGLHRRDFLRHDPNVGRVAPQVAIAIEIDAAVEFSHLRDVTLQANVGWLAAAAAAAAHRELEAASRCSNFLFVEYVECPQADVRDLHVMWP